MKSDDIKIAQLNAMKSVAHTLELDALKSLHVVLLEIAYQLAIMNERQAPAKKPRKKNPLL